MNINEFYKKFKNNYTRNFNKFESDKSNIVSNLDFTKGILDYIFDIFEKTGEYLCICKNENTRGDKESLKEFLSTDFSIFKLPLKLYENTNYFNISYEIMEYVIEHENKEKRIEYNLTKLLNIKAKNKILISYMKNLENKEKKFTEIKYKLKNISNNFNDDEKLLVILGHGEMSTSKFYDARLFHLSSKKIEVL